MLKPYEYKLIRALLSELKGRYANAVCEDFDLDDAKLTQEEQEQFKEDWVKWCKENYEEDYDKPKGTILIGGEVVQIIVKRLDEANGTNTL